MRKKIVARGGGEITERSASVKRRHNSTSHLNYEGRPGDYQMARSISLKKELDDVAGEFEVFVRKSFPGE